jgi:hypothetical protein
VDYRLEMLTEVVQGVIAVTLVAILGVIAVIDAATGKPFAEPTTLAALAGAAVGFYYGQRNQRRQQETIKDLSKTVADMAPATMPVAPKDPAA